MTKEDATRSPSPARGGGQGGGPSAGSEQAAGTPPHGLRAHRLGGAGFKRQKVIGPHIVDFVCLEAKLIVEIDGGQHYHRAGLADKRRDSYLQARGFRVLRFSNLDVLKDRHGVFTVIFDALSTDPLPASPASGGKARLREGER